MMSVDYKTYESIIQLRKSIKRVLCNNQKVPKVMLIGNNEVDISSLLYALTDLDHDSIDNDKKMHLKTSNSHEYDDSFEKQPLILVDPDNRFILFECQKYNDQLKSQQDIKNSFFTNYLLRNESGYENKMIILFVISAKEIENHNYNFFNENFGFVQKIDKDRSQLYRKFGIVITMSDPNIPYDKYIKMIIENSKSQEIRSFFFNNFINSQYLFMMHKP